MAARAGGLPRAGDTPGGRPAARRPGGCAGGPPLAAPDRLEPLDSALLETLLLQAPVAFAFYDTQLRYRRINRLLAEINGLPMAAHIGHRPSEVLPAEIGSA